MGGRGGELVVKYLRHSTEEEEQLLKLAFSQPPGAPLGEGWAFRGAFFNYLLFLGQGFLLDWEAAIHKNGELT